VVSVTDPFGRISRFSRQVFYTVSLLDFIFVHYTHKFIVTICTSIVVNLRLPNEVGRFTTYVYFFFLDFPIYLHAVEIPSANGVLGGEGG
jgi:hypothetical protein